MDSGATAPLQPPKKLAVLSCAVLEQEVLTFAKEYPHVAAVEFLEMNLHETPSLLHDALGQKISEIEITHHPDAIALVYGLCGRGLVGIRAQTCPLVVARAHDCVTLFLGSKDRYLQMQKDQPETYWYTPGWNKTARAPSPEKFERLKKEFSKKFDEENTEYLVEQEMNALRTYKTGAYVDLGIGNVAANEAYAQRCTKWMGWNYQRETGDRRLLTDLLAGRWDEERYLIVPPGHEIQHSADERIMKAVPVSLGD